MPKKLVGKSHSLTISLEICVLKRIGWRPMALADFTIMIHDVYKPLGVRVVVHKNIRALRSAVTQSDNQMARMRGEEGKRANEFKDIAAICQRFHMADSPVYSIVRFAVPDVGVGLVAHEMAHAAIWLWAIKNKFNENVPLRCDNDEWFAWILGELVRQTTVMFYKKGVYKA